MSHKLLLHMVATNGNPDLRQLANPLSLAFTSAALLTLTAAVGDLLCTAYNPMTQNHCSLQ